MKKTILALAIIAALSSCKKSANQTPKNDPGKLATDIPVTITHSPLLSDNAQQGNVNYNFLGFGYDITDQYNDPSSVRSEVVNVPLLNTGTPDKVDINRGTMFYSENFSGENATDLASQLSTNFDETSGLKVFTNTTANAFPNADTFDSKYVYGFYSNVAVRTSFRIIADYYNVLPNYLTGTFVQDVNALGAADLVKKYGTHVLRGIQLGWRFNVIYQAEAPKTNRKKISSTGLRYAMKTIFRLPTGEADPMDLSALNANTSAKIYFYAIGGDQSKLKVLDVNNKSFVNISDWSNHTDQEKPMFIGATKSGLIPLYDLITDVNKKAAVKEYIIKYIQDHEAKLQN